MNDTNNTEELKVQSNITSKKVRISQQLVLFFVIMLLSFVIATVISYSNLQEAKDIVEAVSFSLSGRVMLIDVNYKVVVDSYGKDTGRYIIDKDIKKIMSGEVSDISYIIDNQYQYIFPIINNEGYIDTVAVIAANMDRIIMMDEHMKQRCLLLLAVCLVMQLHFFL